MSSVDFNSETIEMNEMKNSKEDELGTKFIPDIHPSQTSIYHLVPDVEIKPEEMDFHHNHKSTADPDSGDKFDVNGETVSSIPHLDFVSVKAEEVDLNEFYADLLQCQRDCETCKKYMRMLSEHVKSTHCPPQPTQDPLHIDPLNLDPDLPHNQQLSSSPIQIKCEVEESIDKVDCSEEDSRLYSEPHPNTQNVRRRNLTKQNSSSGSKTPEPKKGTILPSLHKYRCNECGKKYTQKGHLTTHMRIHTGEKPFKCDQCERSFTRSDMLSSHKRIHTGEKLYKCDGCGKRFEKSGALATHKRIHTCEKRYKCDVCGKSFSTSSHLSKHKRIHTGEKPYKCEECEMSFITSNDLTRHTRTHTGERPHECNVCMKRFIRSDRLMEHKKRIHSASAGTIVHLANHKRTQSINSERTDVLPLTIPDPLFIEPEVQDSSEDSAKNSVPGETTSMKANKGILPSPDMWNCNECEKSYERRVCLTIHMLVHTGEKPFQCDRCEKSFTRAYELNVHKRMHTGEKLFQCDLCEKCFTTKANLTSHTRTHTGEGLFKCDQCEKSFAQSNHLNSHKRIHTGEKPFKCDQCEKSFTMSGYLKMHMAVHTEEKPFQCDECEKSFSQEFHLTTHKRTHAGETLFRCDQCEKSFTTLNRLTIHKRLHEEFLDLW